MRRYPPALLAAALFCVAAAFSFGAAFVGALSVEPLPHAEPAATDSVDVAPTREAQPLTTDALLLAADSDPFRPERQRWPERYRLPSDPPPEQPLEPPPPPPAPPFRLIGTALSPSGGLAVIEIEGATRVVDMGESLLGYTLADVESESATMVGPGRTVRLPLVATAPPPPPTRGGRPNPPGPGGAGARGAQDLREMIERVRSSGGNVTPQMLEMIQRLQQEGRSVEVQTQQGRTTIRTRPDTTDTTAPRVPFEP